MDKLSEFHWLGAVMSALIALTPVMLVSYHAIMGQVRKAIKEESAELIKRLDLHENEQRNLERKVDSEIGTLQGIQKVFSNELEHIKKGVDRVESMVGTLLQRSTRE